MTDEEFKAEEKRLYSAYEAAHRDLSKRYVVENKKFKIGDRIKSRGGGYWEVIGSVTCLHRGIPPDIAYDCKPLNKNGSYKKRSKLIRVYESSTV